ncbi:putative secondary metabolism biosynthetic enzyme [Mucor velutinosus]|uniref:Secondary metabolism biosynthetic enzyme n=1 Tax=Mucor velutinosus TaxID=708070 RepID=A0AAN7DRD3_9FUNG|nr:putative secondary metabolism biosynthetic enzyme [Mucor velutinosus]
MKSQIIAFTNKIENDVNHLTELYLPCPRSNRRSIYFHNDKGTLYEIQKVTGPGRKSAWLIDADIYKDGAVRFITSLDPLFMALPILDEAYKKDNKKFKTLDDIFSRENVKLEIVGTETLDDEGITSEEYSKPIDVHRLTNITGFTKQLAHVCDVQEIATDLSVYKLNHEKALDWLVKKMDQLMANEAFKKSFESTNQQAISIKLEAVYTLSNYLNKDWFNRLLTKLEIEEEKEETELDDITNYVTDASPSGFFKRAHPDEAFLDTPAKKKKPQVPRSLAKVNTKGMKSITSFFTKK